MKKVILTAVILLAYSSSVFASNVAINGFDLNRAMGVDIQVDGQEYVAGAGIAVLQVNDANTIDSVCANLFEGFAFFENYAADSVSAPAFGPGGRGDAAGWILQTFLPSVTTPVEGAALQLAIWDALHDGGDGFGAGRIQSNEYTDPDVLALASEWVADSHGMTSHNAHVYVAPQGAPVFQEQMYLVSTGGDAGSSSEVPEPGTLAMLALGGLGAAAPKRRPAPVVRN